MKTREFFYELPERLIAQYPKKNRADSRLLCLARASGEVTDRQFQDFPNLLNENDVLVLNNTRVIPARLYGHKSTGGKAEILIERVISEHQALAHVRASKTPRVGSRIIIDEEDVDQAISFKVLERQDDLFVLTTNAGSITDILQRHGHMPLPVSYTHLTLPTN